MRITKNSDNVSLMPDKGRYTTLWIDQKLLMYAFLQKVETKIIRELCNAYIF